MVGRLSFRWNCQAMKEAIKKWNKEELGKIEIRKRKYLDQIFELDMKEQNN